MASKVYPTTCRESDDSKYQCLAGAIKELTSFDDKLATARDHHRDVAFSMSTRGTKLFAWHYLLANVSSKFQEGSTSAAERVSVALGKFLESEVECRKANERLVDALDRPSAERFRTELTRARLIVSEILGTFDAEALPLHCAFSSGASTEAPRPRSMVQLKWDESTHITKKALPYGLAYNKWAGSILGDSRSFEIVAGNVVFTVPKNFERDRVCAKEPSWNMFFQKGVGSMIRHRLQATVGLLHATAQKKHAVLAHEASRSNGYATLDLKAASDSITIGLVDVLVRDDWKQAFYNLRSEVGELPDGTVIPYEKISSMGNGFTFELETLLFYALCKACCGKDELVSVYGDDLIVPRNRVPKIVRLLRFCGFATNPEKSFATGPFRESCGGHFFNGFDVKPFYIRSLPTDLPQVINLHNDIIAWISRTGLKPSRLLHIARRCRALVPRKYWGPLGTDGCLWSEWDEATPKFVRGSRRLNQPAYHHWRVSTARYSMVRQRHDYLWGGVLASLAPTPEQLRREKRCVPLYLLQRKLSPVSAHLPDCDQIQMSELSFDTGTIAFGWVSVGVGQQWPNLPVRLA